jgi:hypothetical protein
MAAYRSDINGWKLPATHYKSATSGSVQPSAGANPTTAASKFLSTVVEKLCNSGKD